ncbi:sulfotransferase domain-containing protein [uncultured Winogradskyella sp.]|uniref:sulfotransferase domain-containing protein n=1 Tax=Winogradskyella sp. 4-2091 TaxID=3381659 RepID=UPI00262F3863|nr:sulfotransferase domain-containing protein [uncultured Winogradskyella sp.]
MNKLKFYLIKVSEILNFIVNIKLAKVKHNQNILIYGISRGGTTLLAETLVGVLKARLIWEPLFNHRAVGFNTINPYSLKSYKELDLGWHPHIASIEDSEVNTYFDAYFNLDKRNIRFFRFSNPKTFSRSKHTIHKMCFGNFMYSYFQKRYNLNSIILLRHPFAVAASSLNFGKNFDYHKENFSSWKYESSNKSDSFFLQYEDKYTLIKSAFTLLVFQSVSQFSYALNHMDKEKSIILFYEDLVMDKPSCHEQLEQFLNCKIDFNYFEDALSKQSFSSGKGHTNTDPMAQLSKWKKVVSDDDVKAGLEIFESFNFKLYSDDTLPVKSII